MDCVQSNSTAYSGDNLETSPCASWVEVVNLIISPPPMMASPLPKIAYIARVPILVARNIHKYSGKTLAELDLRGTSENDIYLSLPFQE